MKKNKRGFTLIELLAVIVILAIIALIAVPVIMNIISESRKSAFKDTAYGIISAGEMYYAESLLDSGMTEEATFTFTDGAVSPSGLNVKGSLPKSGSMKITTEGKIALAITNGELCITKDYDASEIETTEEFESCELSSGEPKVNTLKDLARTNSFAAEVNACVTSGTCTVGTPFAIEVAPGNIQNFYVINDADNKVTLIMDRNVDETTIVWINDEDYGCGEIGDECGSNDKGPLTALNYLESKTSNWTNIEAKNYTLSDENGKYTITRTNARARMITADEADTLIETNDWLYGNLNSWGETTGPYGYWTSTSSSMNYAFSVLIDGYVDGAYPVYFEGELGVRPVIEITK